VSSASDGPVGPPTGALRLTGGRERRPRAPGDPWSSDCEWFAGSCCHGSPPPTPGGRPRLPWPRQFTGTTRPRSSRAAAPPTPGG
jgi:hypothetical protein